MSTENPNNSSSSEHQWVLLMIAISLALVSFFGFRFFTAESNGVVNVSAEQQAFFVGRFLLIPVGLVTLILSVRGLMNKVVKAPLGILAIAIGSVAVLIGGWTWWWVVSINAFTNHFSR